MCPSVTSFILMRVTVEAEDATLKSSAQRYSREATVRMTVGFITISG
uniref:Uncharacterized protein n=1 Tax=Anguilla anguilla TaxID=7936 RepID=A0A0E9WMG4_ANGAN